MYTTRTRCSTHLDNIWMAGSKIHYTVSNEGFEWNLPNCRIICNIPAPLLQKSITCHTRRTRYNTLLLHHCPDTRPLSCPTFGHLSWQNIPIVPVSFQGGGDQQYLSLSFFLQVYFFEKIDVPYWNHSEVCTRSVSFQ